VKSVPGDWKYLKDDDIIADMVHISVGEVRHVAEGVLGIADLDYGEIEGVLPLVQQSCSAASALAVAEKAQQRAEEYAADVVKMEAQLGGLEAGDEKTALGSRLENSRRQAAEKAAIASEAQAEADATRGDAEAAADRAYVAWPVFITMMAHKMGNDTAFVLAYSTIQLNTDAHNPKLDDAGRMTKKMFIANNRRSPDLAMLDDSFVGQLYDEIVGEEIKFLDETSKPSLELVITNLHANRLSAMDANGLSDPYLKFDCPALPEVMGKTKTKRNTLNPHWENSLVPRLSCGTHDLDQVRQQHLFVGVWDWDRNSPDDLIGTAVLNLSACEQLGQPIEFSLDVLRDGQVHGRLTGHIAVCQQQSVASATGTASGSKHTVRVITPLPGLQVLGLNG
jgi:hypothetical protein